MKQFFSDFFHIFFRKELELRMKIFHLLAITGVFICISMTILSIVQGLFVSTVINSVTCIISLGLLIYSAKGGRQELCYWTTVICIFLILFPNLFVFGGGYTGGMGFFFVFAIVFTVYMLDGWKMFVMMVFELFYYSGFCIYAYLYPKHIYPFATELDVLIDVIVGLVIVGISLGLTMFAQFRLYQIQQKELEQARVEAEVANRAKSTFLANISHEIRTPIHVIMSIDEMIRMETVDFKIKSYAEKIKDACELLRSLVENVLDMAKIEEGKTKLTVAPYRTSELMHMLELVGESRCNSKNLEFRCIKKNLPSVLSGDIAHIQKIAINILSNAIKYTETGSVTLSVSCKEENDVDNMMLYIEVTDTGIGIEAESIPTLFESFSRADMSSQRYIEGTGLGLAIVKELCQLMGATIRVESQKGWGSTFTIKIPQKLASIDEVANNNVKKFIAPEGKLLVVDDNPENLSVMQALLHQTHIQVDTVNSGKAALEAVRKKKYHIILLDYMMPGMDGMETLKQFLEIDGFDTPVIALTANAVVGTKEILLGAGFSEYLTKPIPWGELESLLIQYLPEELVTITQLDTSMSERSERFCEEFQPMLSSYYIDLYAAMTFFDGDFEEYLRTAKIFLAHGEEGQKKLVDLQKGSEAANLVYTVHSLKGRAKNIGLTRLAEEAERMEKLCNDGNSAEVQSLIPHLLYLYQLAIEGLTQLSPKMEVLLTPTVSETKEYSVAKYRRELQRYLDQMQRSPALECIDMLLKMEPTDKEREYLNKMRSAVTTINFNEASAIYVDYLRGGNTWILEAES